MSLLSREKHENILKLIIFLLAERNYRIVVYVFGTFFHRKLPVQVEIERATATRTRSAVRNAEIRSKYAVFFLLLLLRNEMQLQSDIYVID